MAKKKKTIFSILSNKITSYSRMLNAGSRSLPDFIIIGTAKGGTTSLFNYLAEHPGVAKPLRKEISYFSTHYQKGINWYKLHFPTLTELNKSNPRLITGEASPYYLSHPLAPARSKKLLPGVKLIVLLRNPIDRAISNYQHIVRLHHENESFEKAIELESGRINGEEAKIIEQGNYFSLSHQYHSYLQRGIYWKELEQWFKEFPREQFLIINSEEFYNSPGKIYLETLKFLGLDRWEPASYAQFNKAEDSMEISPETRKKLTEYFRPHNQRLFELLGDKFDWD